MPEVDKPWPRRLTTRPEIAPAEFGPAISDVVPVVDLLAVPKPFVDYHPAADSTRVRSNQVTVTSVPFEFQRRQNLNFGRVDISCWTRIDAGGVSPDTAEEQ